jgi:uncharacterized repeat protein (TIGR03803 family)
MRVLSTQLRARCATLLATLTLSLLVSVGARAQTVEVLHNFGVTAGDGNDPSGGLIKDATGNFYGTTGSGGAHNVGTVYRLSPKSGGGWKDTILYSFKGGASDGSHPTGLLRDSAGNLYGTTAQGGLQSAQCTDFENSSVGCGIAYKLTPATTGEWIETVLHRFTGRTDGGNPLGGLVRDIAGNLYGTAGFGGAGGSGTVFKLSHTSTGWSETVLHSFAGSADGINPGAPLVFDSLGNLYGATYNGGADGWGIVYRLSPQTNGAWKEQILHTFKGGLDGAQPFFNGGVTLDKSGNVYGSTISGGTSKYYGTVFKLGAANGYANTILHNFSLTDEVVGFPNGGLIFDTEGNLCGTTEYGVFKLTPGSSGWSETVLWGLNEFPSTDGVGIFAPVMIDAQGNLYGTTIWGGTAGDTTGGVAFKLIP